MQSNPGQEESVIVKYNYNGGKFLTLTNISLQFDALFKETKNKQKQNMNTEITHKLFDHDKTYCALMLKNSPPQVKTVY